MQTIVAYIKLLCAIMFKNQLKMMILNMFLSLIVLKWEGFVKNLPILLFSKEKTLPRVKIWTFRGHILKFKQVFFFKKKQTDKYY